MVPAPDEQCGYCNATATDLRRLNNPELLQMMQEHDPNYTRRTRFCDTCINRGIRKLKIRKAKQAGHSTSRSTDKTGSYSNISGLETSSQSSKRPSRNVAKRTGGQPKKPENRSSGTSTSTPNSPASRTRSRSQRSDSPSEMVIPNISSPSNSPERPANRTRSQSQTSGSQSTMNIPNLSSESNSSTRRRSSGRHAPDSSVPQVEVEIEIDNDPGQCGYSSSDSMQTAPLPRNRGQRSESLSQPPTPERMQSMSSSERSQHFGRFKRGGGG